MYFCEFDPPNFSRTRRKLIGPCSNARAQSLAMFALFRSNWPVIKMFIFLQLLKSQPVKVRSVWRIPLLCMSVLNMHNFSPFPMAVGVSWAPTLTFLDFSKIKNRLNFLMWFSKIIHQRGHWGKIWANPKYLSWLKIFDIYWQTLLRKLTVQTFYSLQEKLQFTCSMEFSSVTGMLHEHSQSFWIYFLVLQLFPKNWSWAYWHMKHLVSVLFNYPSPSNAPSPLPLLKGGWFNPLLNSVNYISIGMGLRWQLGKPFLMINQ